MLSIEDLAWSHALADRKLNDSHADGRLGIESAVLDGWHVTAK
jgi:hypothetical protein